MDSFAEMDKRVADAAGPNVDDVKLMSIKFGLPKTSESNKILENSMEMAVRGIKNLRSASAHEHDLQNEPYADNNLKRYAMEYQELSGIESEIITNCKAIMYSHRNEMHQFMETSKAPFEHITMNGIDYLMQRQEAQQTAAAAVPLLAATVENMNDELDDLRRLAVFLEVEHVVTKIFDDNRLRNAEGRPLIDVDFETISKAAFEKIFGRTANDSEA